MGKSGGHPQLYGLSNEAANSFVFSAPENVNNVEVLTQTENSITLMWDKVDSISTYLLKYVNKGSIMEENINMPHQTITHEVSSLTPGTKYNFTLFTVSEGQNSTGYSFEAVTGK